MEKWIDLLKNSFGFTKRESRGFIMVVPMLFLIYLIPKGYSYYLLKQKDREYQQYLAQFDSLSALLEKPLEMSLSSKNKHVAVKDTTYKQKPKNNSYKVNVSKIDFHEADSALLQIVPGIGPKLSGRIIRYRENLGGCIQKEQLLEVYGLSPEVLEKLFDYFHFKPHVHKKLNINELEVADLSKHPYVTNGIAKVIVAFRNQHGNFEKPEDLLKIKIIDQEWVDKMSPYLAF
jgi:competence protein ComEA